MIAILKYNAGNIRSVQNALMQLGLSSIVTDDATMLSNASKVIIPGVGEASTAMEYLQRKKLDMVIPNLKQPVLGICLGLQLMCKNSEEGNIDCLNIFNNSVKKFPAKDIVPHMGWNSLTQTKGAMFSNIQENSDVYFVHSYFASRNEYTVATCEYIEPFSAALQRDNFYATQFHPEKSGEIGMTILRNFLAI